MNWLFVYHDGALGIAVLLLVAVLFFAACRVSNRGYRHQVGGRKNRPRVAERNPNGHRIGCDCGQCWLPIFYGGLEAARHQDAGFFERFCDRDTIWDRMGGR